MTITTTPHAADLTPAERLTLWREQARLCERDGRPDLAAICWTYIEQYERGGAINWEGDDDVSQAPG